MRIAMIAPPWYPIPPKGYGGIELVVYLLARELQLQGHEVRLYSTDGCSDEFDVESLAPGSWSDDLGNPATQRYREGTYLTRVYRRLRSERFDVIHEHSDALGFAIAAALGLRTPVVATVHGHLKEPHRTFLKEIESDLHLVAISRSQASSALGVRWRGVVHNAVDLSSLIVGRSKRQRLIELARISPDKGQHRAIEVARHMGLPLLLAGKVGSDPRDIAYFREMVEPHLRPGSGVFWRENIHGEEKAELLAESMAMLFPIQWDEPFGLAMAEAMASGTPVVATRRGAAPEVVDEGRTGYVVADEVDALALAVERSTRIDPVACAHHARDRFSPERMAEGYARVYATALAGPDDLEDERELALATQLSIISG